MPSSLFFQYPCKPQGGDTCTKLIAWSTVEPVVAVATDNNRVLFFQEEGQQMPEHTVVRNFAPTAMAWQPNSRILAVGWHDGVVSLWHMRERIQREDDAVHKTPICLLKWKEDGTRLVTGDKGGVIGVWQTDARGRLMPICHYRKSGAITHCIFCTFHGREPQDRRSSGRCTSFFFAGQLGVVSYADDIGHCMNVQNLRSPVFSMLYYEDRDRVVIITESLLLTQLEISPNGKVSPVKVKLSASVGSDGFFRAFWVGPGLLLTSSGEQLLRFWDLGNDVNYVLSLSEAGTDGNIPIPRRDEVSAVAYCQERGGLVAGTKLGHILMWRFRGPGGGAMVSGKDGKKKKAPPPPTGPENWQLTFHKKMSSRVSELIWGAGPHLLSVMVRDGALSILNETVLHSRLSTEMAAMQQSPDELLVETCRTGKPSKESVVLPVKCGIRIRGLVLAGSYIVVWNGSKIEIYQLRDNVISQVSAFESKARDVAMYHDSLFLAVGSRVEVTNVSGSTKQTLSFTDTEGDPTLIDINGKHMACATTRGTLKMYDVSRRETKQVGSGIRFLDQVGGAPGSSKINSIRCNADGTRMSVLLNREHNAFHQEPDTRLYVYNSELNAVNHYDCGPERYPISHLWDPQEARLLVIEAQLVKSDKMAQHGDKDDNEAPPQAEEVPEAKSNSKKKKGLKGLLKKAAVGVKMANKVIKAIKEDAVVTTIFATNEYGLLAQDSFPIESNRLSLMGIHVPRLFFLSGGDMKNARRLKSRLMRDFVGLDKVDEQTRKALLEFSYFLTVGNMDAAYRAVKLIQSPSVWENMAHMCVKTKRLDVAEVCLGNMGHARGAKAVREAKAEPELNACVAMVAIQLGLLEDAERLYTECRRFDLLNELYRASGQWQKALTVASKKDRIHLRTTHYLYAKFLESTGDTAGAIKHYESAHAHRYEVPRMLFDSERLVELETYVSSSRDAKLFRWWAQYCESSGDLDKAMKYYELANDYLSQVRIHCFQRNFSEAQEVVMDAGEQSMAAAYHLARQHEAHGNVKEAISFFSRAGRYNHAVRLAKEHHLDSELMQLALLADKQVQASAARYLEGQQQFDKAVQLYHKSGQIARALELCFKAQLFDTLRIIADELGEDTDIKVLERCADFFMDHCQYEKAVHLMLTCKKHEKALELCMTHKITITDEMAKKMTLEKVKGDKEQNERRKRLLMALAKCVKKQGNFHLACKKYTQAGDKMKAMKCLLKSGDTEKIIFFTGVSRSRDIYILAANYLQNLDWHNNPKIMKSIIQFYTKARGYTQLSSFYDACAQVEIDEYRDYEKAYGALKEAVKYLGKVRGNSAGKEEKLAGIQQRIYLVERFVMAKKMVKDDPSEMVKICGQLLDHPDADVAVRVGDVFALLVEFYYAAGNMDNAMRLIEQMQNRKIILSPYLDQQMVKAIFKANGSEWDEGGGKKEDKNNSGDSGDSSSEMEEDIAEDVDEDIGEDIEDDVDEASFEGAMGNMAARSVRGSRESKGWGK